MFVMPNLEEKYDTVTPHQSVVLDTCALHIGALRPSSDRTRRPSRAQKRIEEYPGRQKKTTINSVVYVTRDGERDLPDNQSVHGPLARRLRRDLPCEHHTIRDELRAKCQHVGNYVYIWTYAGYLGVVARPRQRRQPVHKEISISCPKKSKRKKLASPGIHTHQHARPTNSTLPLTTTPSFAMLVSSSPLVPRPYPQLSTPYMLHYAPHAE